MPVKKKAAAPAAKKTATGPDPEKPVRLAVAKLLTQASAEIKKVKAPSQAMKSLGAQIDSIIGQLKDGGEDGVC